MSPVTVEETDRGFDYWASRPFLRDDTRRRLRAVDALLVPQEGIHGIQEPVFPVCTEEVYQLVRERLDGQVAIDIAIEDEDYKELALHSSMLIIGGFVVTSLAAPIVVNVVSEYINRRLCRDLKREEATVRFNLTVEENYPDGSRRISISYDGPASTFKPLMEDAIGAEIPKLRQGSPRLTGSDSDDAS